MDGIRVAIRSRPIDLREKDSRCSNIIQVEKNSLSISCPKGNRSFRQPDVDFCHRFTFDKCYVETENSETTICDDISGGIVQCALNSCNVSLVVFGQKGTGKTFTVTGKESTEPVFSMVDGGIVHHLCQKLFSSANESSEILSIISVSCLEIYNNQLTDLMVGEVRQRYQRNLVIREHPKHGPHVEGLSKYTAKSYEDLIKTIHLCTSRRKLQTWNQYQSSRSHVIINIQCVQASFVDSIPSEITSNISVIDVADRITERSQNIKLNRSEADLINRSLIAFHDIIKSLADAVDRRGTRRKSIYVPFRDSLLTWLLKDSLGGNCVTFMVATISSADSNYNETLQTLQTAGRAQRIINRPTVNVDSQVSRLKELWEANRLLRSSLAANTRPRLMAQIVEIQEKLKKNEGLINDAVENWICKWDVAVTVLGPSAKELVNSWKDIRRNKSCSWGTDSAFGSDIEPEIDSRSIEDFEKTDDRRLPRNFLAVLSPPEIGESSLAKSKSSTCLPMDVPEFGISYANTLYPSKTRVTLRRQESDSRSKDTLRTEIKGQISSLKHVSPFMSQNRVSVNSEDVRRTVVSRAKHKLRRSVHIGEGAATYEAGISFQISEPPKPMESPRGEKPQLRHSPSLPSDVSSLLSLLSKEFNLIENRIGELLHHQQSSIISMRKLTSRLIDDVTVRLSSIESLMRQAKQVKTGIDDPDEYAKQLDRYDRMIESLRRIFRINQLLRSVENDVQLQRYSGVAANLDEARNLIGATNLEEAFEHRATKILQTDLSIVRQGVVCSLIEAWDRIVRWHLPSRTVLRGTRPVTVSLDLSLLHWQTDVSSALVQTMEDLDLLSVQIDGFCDHLLIHFIRKFIRNQGTMLQVVNDADRYAAHVTSNDLQRPTNVPPAEVFQKIEHIFQFLDRPMSRISIVASTGKIKTTLMELIGKTVAGRLFDAVYMECLSQTLQKAGTQWVTYDQIVKATEMFQETMSRLKLLPAERSPLLEFLNTVGTHFGQVKSQELLKKAHDFVTSDLADFSQISVDHPLGMPKARRSIEREEFVKQCKENVRTADYKLPTCQISVPVRSLVCLAYDTLHEASTGSRIGATQLCDSVHGMFELYCDMIPFHHREKVSTIPLLAALHHNNCMFVAHHLITIEKVFRKEILPPKDPASVDRAPSATDAKKSQLGLLVSKIRRLGNEGFGEHVELKQKEMRENLDDAGGFVCAADDRGHDATEAVRDMMNQLKQISDIWRTVLPTNIYCRAIGSLLNSALKDIIESVSGIEEFSLEDCQHLQNVLSYIQNSVGDLFPAEISKTKNAEVVVQENVSNWMKFKELVLFLGFSLADITDHWADGKGPLAMHFAAGEVAKMVVAMFENTSKRSALLAELKRSASVYKH